MPRARPTIIESVAEEVVLSEERDARPLATARTMTSDVAPTVIEDTPVVYRIADLRFFYGSFMALRDVDMDVYENQITALIGPSGCGKTTFLRCLNRMNDLVRGTRVEGTILYHATDLYDPSI